MSLPSAWGQPTVEPPRLDELDHLNVDDGLSHNTVWEIFQDSRGFIWFRTSSGLDRYDGYDVVSYRHDGDMPESIVSNTLTALAEDHEGRLWVGTEAGLDRFEPDQQRFVHYSSKEAALGLPSNQIFNLAVDGSGRLWVSTVEGLAVYDRQRDAFDVVVLEDSEQPEELPQQGLLRRAPDGTLWVAAGHALCRLEEDGKTSFRCVSLIPPEDGADPSEPTLLPTDMAIGLDGRVWVTSWMQGLLRWDPAEARVERFRHDPRRPESLGSDQTMSVWADRQGQVWVGTDAAGLHWYDPERNGFERYGLDPFREGGLSDNGVLDIFEDWQGLLWFSSYLGVDRYDPSREAFRTVRHHPEDVENLASVGVWALHQDAAEELWVGSYTEGMERFDAEGRRIRHYRPDQSDDAALNNGVVSAIVEDGAGDLWVGTWGGLHHFDRETERFTVYVHDDDNPSSLSSNRIFHLLQDREGGLWAGTLGGGISYLPPDVPKTAPRFDRFLPNDEQEGALLGGAVFQTLQDQRGVLWFATSHGLERFDSEKRTFSLVTGEGHDPQEAQQTQALYEDASGVLWVGTDGHGLWRLDAERDSMQPYHVKDGLPSEAITGIVGDDSGRIWCSTDQGLVRFDPQSETFDVFDEGDGLQGRVYTVGSSLKTTEGELFFGGPAGYDRFWPEAIRLDHRAPVPVLTEFSLLNRPAALTWQDAASPLSRDISYMERLMLNHRHNVVGFAFSGLHFAAPKDNRFEYQLEGFDETFVPTGPGRRFAQYTNLPAGDYVFRVRAANEDGVWSPQDASLAITVLPAPWRSWWAYTLYGLALLAAIAWYVSQQRRKIAHEQALNARLRDVNRMKDEFLANTSHELRTPLFGIIGITESLLDGVTGNLPMGTRQNLNLIGASARRLGALVNDILDFSKLSGRELQLNRTAVDLRSLVEVVLNLATPLVGSKQLEVRNRVADDLPAVDADEDRLQQILLNLVGNAIKFTEAGFVEILAFVDGDRMEVQIIDSGIGIPDEAKESIFRAFEQGDASTERQFGGTGLGLAVTKKLVALHGGNIGVRTPQDGGSEFFFTLPISAESTAADSAEEPKRRRRPRPKAVTEPVAVTEAERAVSPTMDLPPGELKILIVDDEPINRQVLRNHLALRQFVVESASSGAEALRIVEQGWLPDLVLLDVMMPKMSGYEVCSTLRERFSSSELPILFLTAKNQPDDLTTGLARGANDYLTKPITKGELLARVKLHLELLWVHRNLEELVQERTSQVKTLGRLVPVCGICKSVRDDTGYWSQIEDYLRQQSDSMVTHGLCPSCLETHYGELFEETPPES